jgi:hypothetical protein
VGSTHSPPAKWMRPDPARRDRWVDYVEEEVAGLGIWVEEEEGDEGGHEGEQDLVGPQPAVLAVESSSFSVASFSPPQASSRASRRA